MIDFGVEVKLLVSDRARGLIKLADKNYLNTYSMPDLFHYSQDLGKLVGRKIGSKVKRLWKKLNNNDLSAEEKEVISLEVQEAQKTQTANRTQIEEVNKTVHPFDEKNGLQNKPAIEKALHHSLNKINKIGIEAGIKIDLDRVSKILNQIEPIAQGIVWWQKWMMEELKKLTLPSEHQQWLLSCVLPYAYWQVHLAKTTSKKKDKALKVYYRQREEEATAHFEQHLFTLQLTPSEREKYVNWAFSMVSTFHRSSSQVEGRNGYLAFIHHAHKGIPKQRQKVLTVVHNFDMRRKDGKTPAQRLFKRDFPDLFDFILENVTDLPLPRRRTQRAKLSP